MLARATPATVYGDLIPFPVSRARNARTMTTSALIEKMDQAYLAGDHGTARALIEALYERLDAEMVSNTRDGGTR